MALLFDDLLLLDGLILTSLLLNGLTIRWSTTTEWSIDWSTIRLSTGYYNISLSYIRENDFRSNYSGC